MKKNYWHSPKVFFIVLNIFLVSFSPVASADNGEATKPIVENTGYTFPAEWEKQSAVWLAWEWNESGESTTDEQHKVTAQIIQALHSHNVKVELILQTGGDSKEEVLHFLSTYNVDPKKINFREYKKPYLFMRDMGPLFLKNSEGKGMIADFSWNMYGIWDRDRAKSIGDVDKAMAQELNIPLLSSDFVAEGGGIEVNGEGVMMTYEDMALQRNPGKSLEEIEKEYLRLYGQKKIIWLKQSPLSDKLTPDGSPIFENFFGNGANGHVDEVARFVDPHTVLVAQISEEARNSNKLEKEDYKRIEEVVETLKRATDVNGKPFKIIRVPSPDLKLVWNEHIVQEEDIYPQFGFKPGDKVYQIPAVSYLNFLISNGVVISAKYWEPGKPEQLKQLDAQSKAILQSAFPGREIVQINPIEINWWGGGIHCITQQQPVYIP
ncbi:agmatine deiminase family protein [Aneurinibacillus aneurinilyticus]|uniref:agmatine deiminase family protein n=1 Tax=Aneurinibacillus aneurinilyticus TaxID=1391 RepID=UPI0035240AE4